MPSAPPKQKLHAGIPLPYRAYEPGIKAQLADMAINGSDIHDTARVLKIDKNTVISTLKKRRLASCKSTPD